MQPPDAVPSLLSAAAPVERHVRDHYTVKGNAWGGLRVATVMRRSSRNDGVCGFNRRVCRGRAHPKAARYRGRRRHARAFIADIRTRDGSSADIRRLRRTADPRSQNRPVPRPGRHRPLRVVCRTRRVPRHPTARYGRPAAFSTLAMRPGTPNSRRQTSASVATPARMVRATGWRNTAGSAFGRRPGRSTIPDPD